VLSKIGNDNCSQTRLESFVRSLDWNLFLYYYTNNQNRKHFQESQHVVLLCIRLNTSMRGGVQNVLFSNFILQAVSPPPLPTRKVILTMTYDLRFDYFLYAHVHTYIIHTYIYTYIHTYTHIYIHTFIMVTFDTGTNFPAVRRNPLLAVAMMNIRHRWNGIGVPTQSHPNAASLTLSAWNIPKLMFEDRLSPAVMLWPWQLSD